MTVLVHVVEVPPRKPNAGEKSASQLEFSKLILESPLPFVKHSAPILQSCHKRETLNERTGDYRKFYLQNCGFRRCFRLRSSSMVRRNVCQSSTETLFELSVKNLRRVAKKCGVLYNSDDPLRKAVLLWRAFNDIGNERIKFICCCVCSAARWRCLRCHRGRRSRAMVSPWTK